VTSAVEGRGVCRAYRRYGADRPWTWQEALVRGWRRLQQPEFFWALRDVSFSIAPGRMVGLIGANGAGKSTLLRLIGGVGRPDAGQITVRGRIGALLELGAGFHPELTGRENAVITGVISGLTKAEVAAQFDAMVRFAELEDFIDSPLRTYSSGMIMRLAFAVAAHIQPEVLLIDEVLSVGDLAFQEKCLERIRSFRARGCTIVLVSHDAEQVAELCDEALWLHAGRLVAHGPAPQVVVQYAAEMSARAHALE
jgi:lipopolysaccharide transport system ATP-binding protein